MNRYKHNARVRCTLFKGAAYLCIITLILLISCHRESHDIYKRIKIHDIYNFSLPIESEASHYDNSIILINSDEEAIDLFNRFGIESFNININYSECSLLVFNTLTQYNPSKVDAELTLRNPPDNYAFSISLYVNNHNLNDLHNELVIAVVDKLNSNAYFTYYLGIYDY